MNVVDWKHTNNISMSHLQGYVQTNYQHIVNVLGEPQWTDGDKTTAEWAVLATIAYASGKEEEVLFTIYDWKTGSTPKGDYQWHVGGHDGRAVWLAEWILDLGWDDGEEEDEETKELLRQCSYNKGNAMAEFERYCEERMKQRELECKETLKD